MSSRAVFTAAAFVISAAAAADEAHIGMPLALAAQVESGDRHGHVVAIEPSGDGAIVTVSRNVLALPASLRFPLPVSPRDVDARYLETPPGFTLPAELLGAVQRRQLAVQVVEEVVAWVTRHIALDDRDAGAQDATAVLARRRGRCSGRANAAIGLLRAVGLPARPVHGVLVGDDEARWHRWGEVWLGTLGWIAFDPGASVGLVSVRYVPMRGAAASVPLRGVRLLYLEERGYTALPRRRGVRVLPSGGTTMTCRAPAGAGWVTAVLLGPDGVRRVRGGDGTVEFRGLLPGRYHLAWEVRGTSGGVMNVWLPLGRKVFVPLAVGGEGS